MKRITSQNWLEHDTAGAPANTDLQSWRETFLVVMLGEGVPQEVAAMFEAARGCFLYGWFFSPLVVLGVEHCYRVLEAGVRVRCAQLGLPVFLRDRQGKEHALSFVHNLRQLTAHGAIDQADAVLCRQAGELRDWAASPKHGNQLEPEHVATAFTRAATLLNKLFA